MKLIRSIFAELFSLFVDDGMLAVATVVLIAALTAVARYTNVPHILFGAALLAGAILILVESIHRAAKKSA